MSLLNILTKSLHGIADFFSCFYVATYFELQIYFIKYVIEPATRFQNAVGPYNYVKVLCPLWLCGRLGFKLYRLREGPKKLSKKKNQLRLVQENISAKLCGLKSPLENAETVKALSFAQLRQRVVIQKDLKVIDVVEALQVHLLHINQSRVSSVAEVIFDSDVTAIMADQAIGKGDVLSAIHGVPVCLSNCFSVNREDCNASAVFKAVDTQTYDCALVSALRVAGAIPVALSNSSPLPWVSDSSSRLYGTTQHPTHVDRVVGGSANAVIVVQKGAFLGFGVDVLGDMRISASNVGIVGFKPTGNRLSLEGIVIPVGYPLGLEPSVGIVASNVSDVADALESLTAVHQSSFIPRMPFKKATSTKKLTIGVFKSLPGLVPVVPAVERVIDKAIGALKAHGHTIVDVELPKPAECLMIALYSLINSKEFFDIFVSNHYGNSLTCSEMVQTWLPTAPRFLRALLGYFLRTTQGSSCETMRIMLKAWQNPISNEEIRDRLMSYQRDFAEMWEDEEIDVLIGPSTPGPALLKASPAGLRLLQTGYSAIFNLVNCPAGSLPFGVISKADVQAADAETAPPKSFKSQLFEQQKTAEGLPVSVQVVARPWADDLVLRVMEEIEGLRSE